MKRAVLISWILLVSLACNHKKTSEISKYYTAPNWNTKSPRIPLYEPLSVYYDRYGSNKWFLSFNDIFCNKRHNYFSIGSRIDSLKNIGADKGVVYGNLDKEYITMNDTDFGDCAIMNSTGTMYFPLAKRLPSQGEVQIELVDSIKRIFLIPKRWYIINTNDTSFNYIFQESEYKTALKELSITETLYNIDDIYNQFNSTGILPWFPDSIKTLLQ